MEHKVIELDVCVDDVVDSELVQSLESINRISPDVLHGDFVLVFESIVPEVVAQQLADQEQMSMLIEVALHLHQVIGLLDCCQDLVLPLTSLRHGCILSNDLDCDSAFLFQGILRHYHHSIHSLTNLTHKSIPPIMVQLPA